MGQSRWLRCLFLTVFEVICGALDSPSRANLHVQCNFGVSKDLNISHFTLEIISLRKPSQGVSSDWWVERRQPTDQSQQIGCTNLFYHLLFRQLVGCILQEGRFTTEIVFMPQIFFSFLGTHTE